MARYQLRRPSAVKIFPRRVRRQQATTTNTPSLTKELEEDIAEIEILEAEAQKEEQGLESPDSPSSSPSTVGGADDSDSDDEAETRPSAATSSGSVVSTQEAIATSIIASAPSSLAVTGGDSTFRTSVLPPSSAEAATSMAQVEPTSDASAGSPPQPTSSVDIPSESSNIALPQVTNTVSSGPTSKITAVTTEGIDGGQQQQQQPTRPDPATSTSSVNTSSIAPSTPAQSERAGNSDRPQRSSPQSEPPILTKSGATAAIILGVLGALALLLGAVIFLKRRKRRQNAYHQRLSDDAFNPTNSGSLRAPETAHIDSTPAFSPPSLDPHATRSTDRSNTLFGAAPYTRPETVSTDGNAPQTPNPFADPPLNKAYDVLAGRPRSTTLTDRGSWLRNPFRNPASERFDPFGELEAKARREREREQQRARERERTREMEEASREAELVLEYEERERQFAAKEKMGLKPEGVQGRKGSGVTVEGVGVLDRSGGGMYR